jgi:small multidrug resistance family-3 protein
VVGKSVALFAAAALAEIGGAYLVWLAVKDGRGLLLGALGVLSLGLYGIVAAFQPENEFGRVLAAYGGVFIVGSIALGSGLRQLPAGPLRPRRRRGLPPRRRGDHVRAAGVSRGRQG